MASRGLLWGEVREVAEVVEGTVPGVELEAIGPPEPVTGFSAWHRQPGAASAIASIRIVHGIVRVGTVCFRFSLRPAYQAGDQTATGNIPLSLICRLFPFYVMSTPGGNHDHDSEVGQ
jgi:hypothetical protein